MLVTISHSIGMPEARAGGGLKNPIRICDRAWIGARATTPPGVTIGQGCVVTAGAVVTRDWEENSLYAGVPARFIRLLQIGATTSNQRREQVG